MKVTLLGTGTPAPSLKRVCSGILIDVGSDVIVLDHGAGAHHRLLETGRKATEVTHCFISHLHYDHCMDYPRLVLQRWDMGAGQIPELKVFGPSPIRRMTDQLFAADGVFGPDIDARCNHQLSVEIYELRGGKVPRQPPAPQVQEIKPGDVVQGDGWNIRVGEVSHVQPQLECYGFRLDSADGSLCYSGDSGGVCKTLIDLANGVDVLIHMNQFTSGAEPSAVFRQSCGSHIDTAHVARQAGVRTLVLTHVMDQIDQPGIRERILKEMMAIYDGDIIWGEDLMEIPVAGPVHRSLSNG